MFIMYMLIVLSLCKGAHTHILKYINTYAYMYACTYIYISLSLQGDHTYIHFLIMTTERT